MWGKDTKTKRVFIAKCAKKQFLLTNSEVITSVLGVSGLKLHSSGTEPVTFFWTQFSLGRVQFLFGGAQAVILGARPRNAPRGAGPESMLISMPRFKSIIFIDIVLKLKYFCKKLQNLPIYSQTSLNCRFLATCVAVGIYW